MPCSLSLRPRRVGRLSKSLRTTNGHTGSYRDPLSSAKSKHIDARFHFIRGLLRIGEISTEYVKSADQHAGTKAFPVDPFQHHRDRLMNIHKSLRYMSTWQVVFQPDKCLARLPKQLGAGSVIPRAGIDSDVTA